MNKYVKRALVVLSVLAAGYFGGRYAFAEYRWWQARRALDEHRIPEARRHLAMALRWFPNRAKVHLLAGRAARQDGDLEAAETHLINCQKLESPASDASILEWAMVRAQEGDLESVEEFLRKQVDRKHPQSILILEAMAQGYLRVYRVFDSLNCLKQWLELRPTDPYALMIRGKAYQRVHAYGEAAADFRQALEALPDNDSARLLLANALVENGQAPDAVPHLEQLRNRTPDDPDIQVRLAFAWSVAGRVAESQALLDEVLKRDPNLGPALSARGQIALQLGRPEEAERSLRIALKLMPYDRQTNYALFQALQQLGKDAEATEQQVRLKKIEKAIDRMIEVSNRLLPLSPKSPELQHELGTLLAILGQEEMGVRWYHSALQNDADFQPAHQSLAEYYERIGEQARAAQHRARLRR